MGVHVFYASPEGWGAWYGAQTTHSSRSSIFVSSLWVAVPEMDFSARKHLCLSCLFYPLSCSPSFQLFFLEGIVPFVVEDLAVFLWDGEFRIFLCFLAWTNQFNSGQLLSHVGFFVTPRTAARQAFLSHHQLLELAQTHVHWVGDPIQPSHPLLIPSPPAFNLCQHQGL